MSQNVLSNLPPHMPTTTTTTNATTTAAAAAVAATNTTAIITQYLYTYTHSTYTHCSGYKIQ